jgi:RNA polymerase sigma-70 factor (ECF subfamily)
MDGAVLSAEELVLKCIQSGDEASWEEFVRRFHGLIATVALRVSRRWGEPSPQLIDDLVQETYLKLCENNFRLLRSFESHHPDAFYGYLKVVTANLVHDYVKTKRAAKRGSGTTEVANEAAVESAAAPASAAAVHCSERRILLKELDAMLCELAEGSRLERDRRIFWLYYRVGLTANAIAALPSIGLSSKGVESTILRLTRLLRQKLAAEPSRPGAGTTPTEGI